LSSRYFGIFLVLLVSRAAPFAALQLYERSRPALLDIELAGS
jgi:hypothetical protein